jgi:UDP-apiose/xylose synthase
MNIIRSGNGAPKRVALFGGGGFVGSNFALKLANEPEFTPLVLDIEEAKLNARFGGHSVCEFCKCDVLVDDEILDQAVRNADIVVNLVSHVLPKKFLDKPLEVIDVTLTGSMKVISAAVKHKKRLIHFSTSEVYGKTGGRKEPFSEDQSDCILGPIDNHRWIYSPSKQLLDRIIHAHGLAGDLEYTIVRPFNFVGPLMDWLGDTDDVPRVFASFMTAMLNRRPLQLVDGGASKRCFTHIDDATRALTCILRNPTRTRNQIFNIGNPKNETTIAELAVLMRGIYRQETGEPEPIVISEVSAEYFYGSGYEDCDRRMPDISKISQLGWRPEINLQETFERSIRYCLDNTETLGFVPEKMTV